MLLFFQILEKKVLNKFFQGPVLNDCTLKNAEEVFIGEKYYCGMNIGRLNYEEGKAACQAINGSTAITKK